MTFHEALQTVIKGGGKIAQRRAHHFDKGGYHDIEWSEWTRVRLDDSKVDFDALLFFETNNFDEENKLWLHEWSEDLLSRADILANDWEITEE